MRKPAYYSIIQYMPDMSRLEVCNVGVIFYENPRTCLITVTDDYTRVKRFFPLADIPFVKIAVGAVVCRIHGELPSWYGHGALLRFSELLANDIKITPPRPMTYSGTRDNEVQWLFTELVQEDE